METASKRLSKEQAECRKHGRELDKGQADDGVVNIGTSKLAHLFPRRYEHGHDVAQLIC